MTTIELIAAAISGGVVTKIFDFILKNRRENRKENRIDFNLMLEELRKDNSYLRDQNPKYLQTIVELRKVQGEMQAKIHLLEVKRC